MFSRRHLDLPITMEDSLFTLFLGFSALWIVMGAAAMVWVLRQEHQDLNVGRQGLLVTLSIAIPFLLALIYGAYNLQQ